MNEICNDNIIYYYILNVHKIVKQAHIISIVFALFVLLIFFIRWKRNKEEHTLKRSIVKTIVIILIILVIPFLLQGFANYVKNHSSYRICIEEEELQAIEENDTSEPELIVKEKNEETKETIEVVEGNKEENELLPPDNEIYFLNVGAGTEAFIISDQGHYGLIDTSYESKANFILKQLEILGATELDFIIITHSHLDHMGGYSKIMSNIDVKTLYIKDPGNVNSDYVPSYVNMIKIADEKGTAICKVEDEICKNFNIGYINLQLYNTKFYNSKGIDGQDRSRVENGNSIAVVATINNRRIYFSSDIGDYYDFNAETKTAEEIGDVDVYKVAHHGYVSYNNGLLPLSYLKPEYVIVTNNKELSINAINRIKNTSPDYQKAYYTTNGTITLHVKGDGTMEFNQ